MKGNSSLYFLIALLVVGAVAVTAYTSLSSSDSDEASPTPPSVRASNPPTVQLASAKLQKYSKSAYEKALADGDIVLLDFHADWCAVCVGNEPKLESALSALNDSNVTAFKVNYDTEKALKRQFNINSQATFIVLKGGKEVKRTMGPQSVEQFKELLSV